MNEAPAPKRSFQRRPGGPERVLKRILVHKCCICDATGVTMRALPDGSGYVCAGDCAKEAGV